MISSFSNGNAQIDEYVDYLSKHKDKSAKNYIIDLFNKYDIVVICERSHLELTQYDLYLDIISTPWFINNVGNILIETGSISNQKQVNDFIHNRYKNDSIREDNLIKLCQNVNWYPCWDNYNYYYFLKSLNQINCNQNFPASINLYPCDIAFPGWSSIKTTKDYQEWNKNVFYKHNRDSVIANQMIQKIDSVKSIQKESKFLIILNSRHAFSKNLIDSVGPDRTYHVTNTAGILFEKYNDEIANVFINYVKPTSKVANTKNPYNTELLWNPIHEGKWDAAFKLLGYESIGFDFIDSPFGNDLFDLRPRSVIDYKYQDIFTGFVYYLSLEKHKEVRGNPQLQLDNFRNELVRRQTIFDETFKKPKSTDSYYDSYFSTTIMQYEEILEYEMIINQWIKCRVGKGEFHP